MNRPKIVEAAFLASDPISVNIAGTLLAAKPRKFSTGSLGYFCSGKVLAKVGDEMVTLQVSANLPICGTKPGE